MKKVLIGLVLGILLSDLGGIYCRVKFERWVEAHKGHTIGMPYTWDMCLGEFIERPIEKFSEGEIMCGMLE